MGSNTVIRTDENIGKDVLFAVLRLWLPELCLGQLALQQFKGLMVNNRLVNVSEDHPILFRILDPLHCSCLRYRSIQLCISSILARR